MTRTSRALVFVTSILIWKLLIFNSRKLQAERYSYSVAMWSEASCLWRKRDKPTFIKDKLFTLCRFTGTISGVGAAAPTLTEDVVLNSSVSVNFLLWQHKHTLDVDLLHLFTVLLTTFLCWEILNECWRNVRFVFLQSRRSRSRSVHEVLRSHRLVTKYMYPNKQYSLVCLSAVFSVFSRSSTLFQSYRSLMFLYNVD